VIKKYCSSVLSALDLLVDRYLHGYDTEEMCVAAKMCSAHTFMVSDSEAKATNQLAMGTNMNLKPM